MAGASSHAPLGNAVKDLDTGKHGVVERSRTRQSLDLPRRSPNSGEFGYKESFTALPVGAIRVFTQRYPGLRDERCTLDAPPWAGIGSPLRGWDLDQIVT